MLKIYLLPRKLYTHSKLVDWQLSASQDVLFYHFSDLILCLFFPGLIKSLNGLNINNNPLEFPPVNIVERGTTEILKFLREMIEAKSSGNLLNGGSKYKHDAKAV